MYSYMLLYYDNTITALASSKAKSNILTSKHLIEKYFYI